MITVRHIAQNLIEFQADPQQPFAECGLISTGKAPVLRGQLKRQGSIVQWLVHQTFNLAIRVRVPVDPHRKPCLNK